MSNVAWQIPLQANPNATSGPDPNKMQDLILGAAKIKEVQQQQQGQNALRALFADPNNVDPKTGMLKPEATAKLMAANPAFGLDYNKAAAGVQETQTQTRALSARTDLVSKIQSLGAEMADETLGTYDNAVKNGMPPERAQQLAQLDYSKHLDELTKSGMLSPEQLKMIPTQFDPVRVRNQLLDYKTRIQLENKERDEKRADQRLADQESHEERMAGAQIAASNRAAAAAATKGWDIKDMIGPDGKPVTVRVNKDTGEIKPLEMPGGQPVALSAVPSGQPAQPWPPEAIDYAAENYRLTGKLPPNMQRNSPVAGQIVAKAAAIGQNPQTPLSPAAQSAVGAVTTQAGVRADTSSLTNITKIADASEGFENTMLSNMKIAEEKMPAGAGPTTLPFIDRWVESGRTEFGDANVPPYVTSLLTVANEYAKVMSGSTGSQGSTVDSRKEAREMLNAALNSGQINQIFDVMRRDVSNKKQSYRQQEQAIKDRISGKPTEEEKPASAATEDLPKAAIDQLSSGHVTTFANGQQWTLGADGQPQRVK